MRVLVNVSFGEISIVIIYVIEIFSGKLFNYMVFYVIVIIKVSKSEKEVNLLLLMLR